MATKFRAYTEEDYVRVGRQYGSDDVAREAHDVRERWQRDLALLAPYGFGADALGAFAGYVAEHSALRAARPVAIAAKAVVLGQRGQLLADGWRFVDQATGVLSLLALSDAEVAAGLNAYTPADGAALDAGIRGLGQLLTNNLSRLPGDGPAPALAARAPGLAQEVADVLSGAELAKRAPQQDTRELDLLDGRLMVFVRALNKAARRAFRALGNDPRVGEYRLHHAAKTRGSAVDANTPAVG